MAHLIVGVEWDTDGESLEDCGLPKNVLVLDTPELINDDEEEQIACLLSDAFGFCHTSWSWEYLNHYMGNNPSVFPPNLGVCYYKGDYK